MTTTQRAKVLRDQMNTRREAKATLKEIKLLLDCKAKEDYKPMLNTRLYRQHGGEYCEYLQML